jgi:predicted ATPase
MAESEIILIHDILFEYLKTRHQIHPDFVFSLYDGRDHLLWEKGYWLNGDNQQITLQFPVNFYYQFNYNFHLVYKLDSQNWECYLNLSRPSNELIKTIQSLNFFQTSTYKWKKEFAHHPNFLKPLANFLDVERPLMEAKLSKQPDESRFVAQFESILNRIAKMDVSKRPAYIQKLHQIRAEMSQKSLPFALSKIEIINFQGIKHLIIDNLNLDAQWIFLTGENGFGKTSILRAIALGLVGDEYADQKYLTETAITVYGCNWAQPFRHELKPQLLAQNEFQIAAYGAARFQMNHLDQIQPTGKVIKKTYSLFYDDGVLRNIERVLIDSERDDLPTFNRLKELFLKIIPSLADIKSELMGKKRVIRYYEKNEYNECYAPVLLYELAAGYRGVLTMIGDMVQRLSEHPHNSLSDLQGVVLIDEIDAHLHPKYQYELPNLLSETFPKVQFIVTTHSPIPILGLSPDKKLVVLTVDRNPLKGITVDRKDDDFDIQQLNASSLLSSPMFGLQTLLARGAKVEHIIASDDFKDVEKVAQIKKRLQELRQKGFIQ